MASAVRVLHRERFDDGLDLLLGQVERPEYFVLAAPDLPVLRGTRCVLVRLPLVPPPGSGLHVDLAEVRAATDPRSPAPVDRPGLPRHGQRAMIAEVAAACGIGGELVECGGRQRSAPVMNARVSLRP